MQLVGIVDDDEDVLKLLEALLQKEFRLSCHTSFEEALKRFKKEPPDLILLDISLPGKKGDEVLKVLQETQELKHIKVIALTGYTEPEDRKKFLNLGFDEYLSKPILNPQGLVNLIKRLLS